jgi:hypothetical protein
MRMSKNSSSPPPVPIVNTGPRQLIERTPLGANPEIGVLPTRDKPSTIDAWKTRRGYKIPYISRKLRFSMGGQKILRREQNFGSTPTHELVFAVVYSVLINENFK